MLASKENAERVLDIAHRARLRQGITVTEAQWEELVEFLLAAKRKLPSETDIAHEHSASNHDEVLRSETCGCFYCCRVFPPSEIKEWANDGRATPGKTARCPHCDIDSVLGSASGFPITPEFLKRMNECWFQK